MRLLGWLIILLALAEFGFSAWNWFGGARTLFRSVGEFWFANHPNSLQLAQPAIERYVLPDLWNPVIVTFLTWPLVAVLMVIGVALLLLARIGKRKRLMR